MKRGRFEPWLFWSVTIRNRDCIEPWPFWTVSAIIMVPLYEKRSEMVGKPSFNQLTFLNFLPLNRPPPPSPRDSGDDTIRHLLSTHFVSNLVFKFQPCCGPGFLKFGSASMTLQTPCPRGQQLHWPHCHGAGSQQLRGHVISQLHQHLVIVVADYADTCFFANILANSKLFA